MKGPEEILAFWLDEVAPEKWYAQDDALDARICTYECTFCADCAEGPLAGVCPNCGGNLVARPVRPAAMLARHPASTVRVLGERPDCALRFRVDDGRVIAGGLNESERRVPVVRGKAQPDVLVALRLRRRGLEDVRGVGVLLRRFEEQAMVAGPRARPDAGLAQGQREDAARAQGPRELDEDEAERFGVVPDEAGAGEGRRHDARAFKI